MRVDERWVVRAEDQRTLDRRAEASGIAEDALMESAGTNAATWIVDHVFPRRVAVFSGPGGNGGDALVVARRLHEAGVDVETFALAPSDRWSPAARRMADRLRAVDARPVRVLEDGTPPAAIDDADCIVDGLFGSGLSRPLDGPARRLVERLNGATARTISLDLPSGLPSDCGELLGEAVRADTTLAMAFLKPAHLLYPAAGFCGNVAVVGVDYPEATLADAAPWARVCETAGIARRLPARPPDGHKGTFGSVLVVAGSIGMTGAAILACRGALRAGAGLVRLAIPASLDPILETALPETITVPLPDTAAPGRLTPDGLDAALLDAAIDRSDVLAIGPGLSRHPASLAAAAALIDRFDGPIVVDADGVHALIDRPEALARLADRGILTPHAGEFAALADRPIPDVLADRRTAAADFAAAHRAVTVLKGRPTAIAAPDGDVFLNPTGNDALATGGSGDVLTGLIAGFLAGGVSLVDAAVAGAYIHGLAAEAYVVERAARSMIASDLLDLVPVVLKEIER